MNADYSYVGSELDLFKDAGNWKNYYRRFLEKYISGVVLEVGSGIGATTRVLVNERCTRWLCLEPDAGMAKETEKLIREGRLPACCEGKTGFVSDLDEDAFFDVILYVDVIEHIEHHGQELRTAVSHLRPAGVLGIVAPAHSWLFTPFDRAIGHYRRYNRKSLLSIIPDSMERIRILYLDSVGLIASLGNRLMLKKSMPTYRQVMVWDRALVPLSRICDPLTGYRIGKSLLGIWRKTC